MSTLARTRVELVRHGEPRGGERFRGSGVDDPLSPAGWAQLEHACAGGQWDVVVSSPLRRCAQFGQALAQARGLDFEVVDDLREIGFGQWEGLTSAEVVARWGGQLRAFWRDPEANLPQGAEPVADFARRVDGAWQDLLARHAGRRVLVIAHGGTVRMVVRAVLGMALDHAWRMRLAYASVTEIEVQHHADYTLAVLVRLGATQVLPGAGD